MLEFMIDLTQHCRCRVCCLQRSVRFLGSLGTVESLSGEHNRLAGVPQQTFGEVQFVFRTGIQSSSSPRASLGNVGQDPILLPGYEYLPQPLKNPNASSVGDWVGMIYFR